MTQEEYISQQAKLELARRDLWYYCNLINPEFYTEERTYLVKMCRDIQDFIENSSERFLIVTLPPRHGKSFTIKNLTEWLFGINPKLKIMTASYNEILSTNFARQVRNTIATEKVDSNIVYSDIFPNTKIKFGEASASLWSLSGSKEKNYLATSINGTNTGFGCNIQIYDDMIRNSEEAYNENALDKIWDWFTNTMLQRLEGNWKIIVIMTRWSEGDLVGRILNNYKDIKEIKYKAIQDDGSMLCDSILSKEDYDLKTKEMNRDIVEANYQQTPIDLKGRLYSDFKEWETLPSHTKKYNYSDTADTGSDFLCSIDFVEYNNEAYITDIIFTDQPMEQTEEMVATMFYEDNVNEAIIESNNGGRGFARNVERILKDKYSTNKTVIKPVPQRKNKISRILTSSSWVNKHIYMPLNWKTKYPDFYNHIKYFNAKGKNKHDDGADVLAGIYDLLTVKAEPKIYSKEDIGLVRSSQPSKSYWRFF